jgi:fluoride exporter
MSYLYIAIGSALGGMLRHWCGQLVARQMGEAFPWGTVLVNILGCFIIGVLGAFTVSDGRWVLPIAARQFLSVGVLGGFTTFSAFSLQTLMLARAGEWLAAGTNVAVSVVLCLMAVSVGFALALWFNVPLGSR